MNPLSESYSNLQSWKFHSKSDEGISYISFSQNRAVTSAILIFLFCEIAAILVMAYLKEGKPLTIATLSAIVGILVPVFILILVWKERKLGDLIQFNSISDSLFLPRSNQIIESARSRVSFSYEHYVKSSSHFFELNLVLDNQRTKLVSSIEKNGFSVIIKGVEKMGFVVSHSKLKIT